MAYLSVFARWRPLTDAEIAAGEISRTTTSKNSRLSVSLQSQTSTITKPWSSAFAFTRMFEPDDSNSTIFSTVVAPALPRVLSGASCNFFAYGHSGSGKTHTIIGYNYNDPAQLGLTLAAAHSLFGQLITLNADRGDNVLGIGFSLFELRQKSAFDLLNNKHECHIREGYDGKTHIRGPTEMLEGGKVRVRPIVKTPCWTFEELRDKLQEALGLRQVGNSSVHDQSSRTHAVLELEIITTELLQAREVVIEKQSELVPVAKHATDITVAEQTKGVILLPGGGWKPNPDYVTNQKLIDDVKAEQQKYEKRVEEAEAIVSDIFSSKSGPACLGGKLVFVDLAGAEYQNDSKVGPGLPNQTPQAKQEGRQINTDLLALKEVIRAISNKQSRIPYRSSPLTMVLREHFQGGEEGMSAMIVTLSPSKEQERATVNSLKYASLVGSAGS